ncbi:MAG: hypothetical protein KZQ77_13355 [Candidatus Thiodiazotropha sp. (ex Notomyrtea botanica)]|nr:hypothetical protein [Candidatus Thiodiazotropha sp. (ex Notomyrtea botanica)]
MADLVCKIGKIVGKNMEITQMIIASLRGSLGFMVYLFHVDGFYKLNLLLGITGLIVAVWGFSNDLIAVVGAFIAVTSFCIALWISSHYKPSWGNEFVNILHDGIPIPGVVAPVKFRDFKPTTREESLGYKLIDAGFDSGEVALSSRRIDQWLFLNQPAIAFTVGRSMAYRFCFQDKDEPGKFEKQIKYLYGKVKGKSNTTNENKFSMSPCFDDSITDISLAKVGYFDALVTNEAYRSTIREKLKSSEQYTDLNIDLRMYFPYEMIYEEDIERVMLSEMPIESVANHVGITTLVLSKDNYPIIFEQKKDMDQLPGKISLAGSGSADYRDIKDSGAEEFLDVIKYSMAREFFEEGKQNKLLKRKRNVIRSIANDTIILGYFRWVDRCGKPEFIGATRSRNVRAKIVADRSEMNPLTSAYLKPIRNHKISETAHFVDLAKKLENAVNEEGKKCRVGLSSAMTIFRLAEIAMKNANDPEQVLLSSHLNIKATQWKGDP